MVGNQFLEPSLGVLRRSFASGGGEARRGTRAPESEGVRLGHRGRKLAEGDGQAARGRSRGSAGAQVCAGAGPGLRPAHQASCLLPPRRPPPLTGPVASRAGTYANKDASIYLPLPADF